MTNKAKFAFVTSAMYGLLSITALVNYNWLVGVVMLAMAAIWVAEGCLNIKRHRFKETVPETPAKGD